jgi:tRNA pseudouridine38-40 synthase
MRTIKLTLAYDGSEFYGWQIQPTLPTVQGAVAAAVEAITGERATIHGSGRTDAGVHALGQVASFRTESSIPAANLVRALNRQLPPAIRVLAAEEAPPGFHARFQARAKTYRYRIYRGEVCPPFLYRYVHHFPYPLDEPRMVKAAPLFEGTHDFTSLAATASTEPPTEASRPAGAASASDEDGEGPGKSKVRTIFSSLLAREGEELVYTVRGSGFLHHMVRNIAGTLVEIGKGGLSPEQIPEILAARHRSAAGPTLPGNGLWLVSVEY